VIEHTKVISVTIAGLMRTYRLQCSYNIRKKISQIFGWYGDREKELKKKIIMLTEVKIQVVFMSTVTIEGRNSDAKIPKGNIDKPKFSIA